VDQVSRVAEETVLVVGQYSAVRPPSQDADAPGNVAHTPEFPGEGGSPWSPLADSLIAPLSFPVRCAGNSAFCLFTSLSRQTEPGERLAVHGAA
jgi:hypothetical protein